MHHLHSHVVSGLVHGTAFENTARDYLRVVKIAEAVYNSDDTGRKLTV